jgi:protoporphyrinogen oxidase
MIPYNLKVWQHDLKKMSYGWIGERVSLINVEKVIDNIMNDKDDISWGTHNRFRYPAKGGMGGVFCRLSGMLARHPLLGMELLSVDLKKKRMAFKDGSTATYDYLINTSSLDTFFLKVLNPRDRRLSGLARKLKHTKTYIVGIGIEGTKRFDTCWIYFPAKETSFYRVTYSNYSPYNVPGRGTYSITCEVSSRSLGADHGGVVKRVVEDLVATGLISWKDRRRIVSTHILELERSYPVPTIDRDLVLNELQSFLRAHHIYSRGRFGAWKYEIGNMDHSFMQGVEAVDKILFGKRERTLV